jgi:16S rRNA (guanine(966)-N(2))-methyltransferase RsmD
MKGRDSRNYIHINSGKYRGKKIYLPDIETTRPSKSIVRDSIFNSLQSDIYDTTFIEMFAGSGSVGFEAISRGAEKLYLLEMNRTAIKTLQENIKQFPDEVIEVVSGDSFENLKRVVETNSSLILYIDPPFNIRSGMESIYSRVYKLLNSINSKNIELIIFEHISSEKPADEIGSFINYKRKKFGKTSLSYYRKSLDLSE